MATAKALTTLVSEKSISQNRTERHGAEIGAQ
jgi:hypothetical protein